MTWALNPVEQALEMTDRMIRARAALHVLLGDKYGTIVRGWKSAIREKMDRENGDLFSVCHAMLVDQFDGRLQLEILAAALEVLEEDVR